MPIIPKYPKPVSGYTGSCINPHWGIALQFCMLHFFLWKTVYLNPFKFVSIMSDLMSCNKPKWAEVIETEECQVHRYCRYAMNNTYTIHIYMYIMSAFPNQSIQFQQIWGTLLGTTRCMRCGMGRFELSNTLIIPLTEIFDTGWNYIPQQH